MCEGSSKHGKLLKQIGRPAVANSQCQYGRVSPAEPLLVFYEHQALESVTAVWSNDRAPYLGMP